MDLARLDDEDTPTLEAPLINIADGDLGGLVSPNPPANSAPPMLRALIGSYSVRAWGNERADRLPALIDSLYPGTGIDTLSRRQAMRVLIELSKRQRED